MANRVLMVFENNRPKRRESANETLDFSSIRIGASELEISEDAGSLSLNSNNVVNAGTINGVTVEAHAARHISEGADEIDGDRLDIDLVPVDYTATATGTDGNATTTAHLTAHLKGIDNRLAEKLNLAGGTMSGDINMGNSKITNLADPTSDNDAVNKAYVDAVAAGLDPKESARIATTADIDGNL
jgi:hypothetical protein